MQYGMFLFYFWKAAIKKNKKKLPLLVGLPHYRLDTLLVLIHKGHTRHSVRFEQPDNAQR